MKDDGEFYQGTYIRKQYFNKITELTELYTSSNNYLAFKMKGGISNDDILSIVLKRFNSKNKINCIILTNAILRKFYNLPTDNKMSIVLIPCVEFGCSAYEKKIEVKNLYNNVFDFAEFVDSLRVNEQTKIDKLANRIMWERYYNPSFNWNASSSYTKNDFLDENFIEEFQFKINWDLLCVNQKLTDNIIREYANRWNWRLISQYQTLSKELINDFHKKINWHKYIKYHQDNLAQFIYEDYKDIFLKSESLLKDIFAYQTNIPESVKAEYREKLLENTISYLRMYGN